MLNYLIKVLSVLMVTSSALFVLSCTQSEVAYEKMVKMINEKVGKHEVKIKEAEKLLTKMKEAQKKAKLADKMGQSTLSQNETKATEAAQVVQYLNEKLEKLKAMETKGAPYIMSTGEEITRSKLNELKNVLQTRLSVEVAKKRNADSALKFSKSNESSNQKIAQILQIKIIDLQGKIEVLKNNIDLLQQMESQARLKKEYDSSVATSILKDIDKAIVELETEIDVDFETIFNEEPVQPGGLKASDVDLLDSL
jgi:hypothetical protein